MRTAVVSRLQLSLFFACMALAACSASPGSGLLSLTIAPDASNPPPVAAKLVLSGPRGIDRTVSGQFPPAGGGDLLVQFPDITAGDASISLTVQAFDASGCLVGKNSAELSVVIKAGAKTEATAKIGKVAGACADGGGMSPQDGGGDASPLDGGQDQSTIDATSPDRAQSVEVQATVFDGQTDGVLVAIDYGREAQADSVDISVTTSPDGGDRADVAIVVADAIPPTLDAAEVFLGPDTRLDMAPDAAPDAVPDGVPDGAPDLPEDATPDAPTDTPAVSCGLAVGSNCCAGNVCTAPGTVCGGSGTCLACGSLGLPCCGDSQCATGTACGGGGTCVSCGGESAPCCVGNTCNSTSNVCSTGTCVACGALNQPCCASGTCDGAGSVCASGTCTACGALDQPCCAGSTCSASSTICGSNGKCAVCGGVGQSCCTGSTCSEAGSQCTSSNTCSTCVAPGIVVHTETEFGVTAPTTPSILTIDATHFLVLNASTQAISSPTLCGSFPIYSTILTVSPTAGTVTVGATVALPGLYAAASTGPYVQAALVPLGSSLFALLETSCTSNSSSAGFAEIVVIDPTADTVTLGSPYVFEGGWLVYLSAAPVDSGHILVAYQGGSNIGYANLMTVAPSSAPQFSWLPATTFGGIGQYHTLTALGGDRFLDVYRGTSNYAAGRVMTVGSARTSFDIGSESILNSDGTYTGGQYFPLDSSNFFGMYTIGTSPNETGHAMVLNVAASNALTVTASLSSFPGTSPYDTRSRSGGPFGSAHYITSFSTAGVGEAFSLSASAILHTITVGASATCPSGGCPLVGATLDSKHYLGYRTTSNDRLAVSVVDVGCP